MNYLIYELATGRIVEQAGSSFLDDLPDTAPGLGKLIGSVDDITQWRVVDGSLVSIPPTPSIHHVWDWTLAAWVDPRNLDQLKDAKWAEIRAQRQLAEQGGFTWSGMTFDSDTLSQQRIQGAAVLALMAQLGSMPWSIDWTLADNSVVTLSAADMIAVGQALGAHVASVHATARALRLEILAAGSAEALAQVAW
jgi:hypothetical protein